MPLWWLQGQNPLERAEVVTAAEGNGVAAAVVMATVTCLTPAAAQKTLTSRQVAATAVHAEVVPVEASTLRQVQNGVEK